MLDQAASSASNVAFVLFEAHVLSTAEFGRVSLLIGAYIVILGMQRSFVTDPHLIAEKLSTPLRLDALLGGSLLVSAVAWPIFFIASIGSTRSVVLIAVVLACGLPALGVVDAYRMAYFRAGSPQRALVLDVAWLVVQLILSVILFLTNRASGTSVAVSWVGGAFAAVILGVLLDSCQPSLKQAWVWLSTSLALGRALAVDFLSGQGAAQLSLVAIAAVAGASQVVDIKLVQLALGPLLVAIQGLRNSCIPLLQRRSRWGQKYFANRMGVAFAVIGLVVTIAMLACPTFVARAIFGDVWQHRPAVITLIGLQCVAAAYTVPHTWLLQLRRDVSALARVRTYNGLLTVAFTSVCAAMWGQVGASAALLTGAVVMSTYVHLRANRVHSMSISS